MDSNHILLCHLAALVKYDLKTRLTESTIKSHLKHNEKLSWRSFDDLIDSKKDLFEIRVALNCKLDNCQS